VAGQHGLRFIHRRLAVKLFQFAALAIVSLASNAQVSVVPSTGIAPQFPKLDAELFKQVKPPSRNWLRDANDDVERFRRIELWAAAGDQEMHEMAARLKEMRSAISRESWDMAIYQLEKIRGRMAVAMTKRPVRTRNMEAIFLDSGAYQGLHDALTAKDPGKAREGFTRARGACMACHTAERVAFVNESAVFGEVPAFPAPPPN
jgi:hypothetical protein